MTAKVIAVIAPLAEQHWGMFTTAQAASVGVERMQLSRLASAGAIERMAKGIYRMAGAPSDSRDDLRVAWLALGGLDRTADGVSAAVAMEETAAELHEIGDLYTGGFRFAVPERRRTRLPETLTKVRKLTREQVTFIDGMPVTSVEQTIADLVAKNTDLSLVGDVVADAVHAGKVVSLTRLDRYLESLATRNGVRTGQQLRESLYEIAGV
ncbi:type IV toxin-antitoxin system AbiEi family antitoxin domain-containing protein [Sediminivirga luteola]|nr:type IV toxin-antitoxin system AbiEi family antitoxin domain-containing protein [Sediminivirga luteola]